jgi:hypothetical protein
MKINCKDPLSRVKKKEKKKKKRINILGSADQWDTTKDIIS